MKVDRRVLIAGALSAPLLGLGALWARRGARSVRSSYVWMVQNQGKRIVRSNGIPDHPTGDFPNRHDPAPIREQNHVLEMPVEPVVGEKPSPLEMWLFGVALNGIPFDPSGPFWNGDGRSGWQFEVLHPANSVALGIDPNHAHTQGRGTYHYHGLPTSLLYRLTAEHPDRPMTLLGYAADGFPIYGPEGPSDPTDLHSPIRRLRPSYRLRAGHRKGGPKGRFDGRFVEDHQFLPGHGDLDECNGRSGPTPEYPDGIYYYVLTDAFPYIPRWFKGQPDPSFRHGPPLGVSPPVPPELRDLGDSTHTS